MRNHLITGRLGGTGSFKQLTPGFGSGDDLRVVGLCPTWDSLLSTESVSYSPPPLSASPTWARSI